MRFHEIWAFREVLYSLSVAALGFVLGYVVCYFNHYKAITLSEERGTGKERETT